MTLDMNAMRALLAAEEEKNQNRGSGGSGKIGEGPVYPHWSIPVDTMAVVRFLPDGGENPFFWVDRTIRKIPFTAVKGVDLGNRQTVDVQVPDLEVFEKGLDPIQKTISPWWNEGRHEEYRTYKRRMSHIYQGFVRVHPGFVDGKGNPVDAEQPENPIRRFILSPKIHETVKAIIMNAKVKHSPVDFDHGRDFEIHLRKQGQFNNYDASQWSFEEDGLTDDEIAALEKFGLESLKDFVPSRPDDAHINAIEELFQASLAGLPYDFERWGEFYRPGGVSFEDTTKTSVQVDKTESVTVEGTKTKDLLDKVKKTAATEETAADSVEPPFETDTPKEVVVEKKTTTTSTSTADLLAKLKAQNQKKEAAE